MAFEGLLNDGRALAARLAGATASRNGPVLVNIATDGESYGHHHRFGEMALSAAIEALARDGQVQLTNYAAYLDRVPLQDDVEVRDNSAWSCAHGIERWRSNCGCNSGLHPGWTQAWRGPLREALDWMKGQLDDVYERRGGRVLRDPWAARDAYIEVLLAPDGDRRRAFLETHARRAGGARDATRIWKLLELQRHGLLAFTSCGWFFDECSGIETVQILTYAARALQLAGECRRATSSRSSCVGSSRCAPISRAFADGRDVYRTLVLPQRTDHARLLAHYAINGLFTPPKPDTHVYACRMRSLDRRAEHAGSANFAVGHARVLAEATQEREDYMYAALHLGGHDIHCAVVPQPEAAEYRRLKDELFDTFFAEPLTELLRRIDRAFGQRFYTLRDVFAAERRQILDQVTARVMADCTADYERIVTDNRRVLDFLAQANVPLPDALRVAASFVLQRRLETAAAAFAGGADAADAALTAWTDARRWGVVVPGDGVARILEDGLESRRRAHRGRGYGRRHRTRARHPRPGAAPRSGARDARCAGPLLRAADCHHGPCLARERCGRVATSRRTPALSAARVGAPGRACGLTRRAARQARRLHHDASMPRVVVQPSRLHGLWLIGSPHQVPRQRLAIRDRRAARCGVVPTPDAAEQRVPAPPYGVPEVEVLHGNAEACGEVQAAPAVRRADRPRQAARGVEGAERVAELLLDLGCRQRRVRPGVVHRVVVVEVVVGDRARGDGARVVFGAGQQRVDEERGEVDADVGQRARGAPPAADRIEGQAEHVPGVHRDSGAVPGRDGVAVTAEQSVAPCRITAQIVPVRVRRVVQLVHPREGGGIE